jgi:hypothetical protein
LAERFDLFMKENSMRKYRNGWAGGISLVLTTAVVGSALAHDVPKATSVGANGAMTFPNVTVVNVAPTQPEKAVVSSQGMIATIDAATGQLRAPTADEAKALAAKPVAKASIARRSAVQSSAASAAASDTPAVTYGDDGSISATLTEEQMVYQVAHKQGDKLVTQEAVGKTAAQRALAQKNTREVSNER